MTPKIAQEFLDKNFAPWFLALWPEVTEINEKRSVIEMPIGAQVNRIGDVVSGQALAAIADATMALAGRGQLGPGTKITTLALNTQYLRPATGDRIKAIGEITQANDKTVFARASLISQPSNEVVALATATLARQ